MSTAQRKSRPTVAAAAGEWLAPLEGHWIDAACAHLSRHPALVRVTVIALRGSAPREAGATMLVDTLGTVGSIGGGRLEWQATLAARELLAHPRCCAGAHRGSHPRTRPRTMLRRPGGTVARAADSRRPAMAAPRPRGPCCRRAATAPTAPEPSSCRGNGIRRRRRSASATALDAGSGEPPSAPRRERRPDTPRTIIRSHTRCYGSLAPVTWARHWSGCCRNLRCSTSPGSIRGPSCCRRTWAAESPCWPLINPWIWSMPLRPVHATWC